MCKIWSRNVEKCGKYSLAKFANFVYFCITSGNSHHFWRESGAMFVLARLKVSLTCKLSIPTIKPMLRHFQISFTHVKIQPPTNARTRTENPA